MYAPMIAPQTIAYPAYPGATLPAYPGQQPTRYGPPSLMPSPEMQQVYQQAFQDIMTTPKKREAFLSLVQEAQQGKLPPTQIYKRMQGILDPNDVLARPKKETAPPEQVLLAMGLATLGGVALGTAVSHSFKNLERGNNSTIEKVLRFFDSAPGLSGLSQKLENHLDHLAKVTKGKEINTLLNLDGAYYTASQLRQNYVQRHFGRDGFLSTEIQQLGAQLRPYMTQTQIKAITNGLHQASRKSDVLRVIKPDLANGLRHFLPDSMQEVMSQVSKQSSLKAIDELSSQNVFLKLLGESAYEQEVDAKLAHKLLEEMKTSNKPFARFYESRVLGNKSYNQLVSKILNGKPMGSYEQLRQGMGLKPFWIYLNDVTSGLLYKGKNAISLGATSASTLMELEKRVAKHHIAGELHKLPLWKPFDKRLRGTLLRTSFFESFSSPILESEYNLMRSLKQRGIGPIGRGLGKLWFSLNQMFNAGNFHRWTLGQMGMKKSLLAPVSSSLGRIGIGALVFALSAQMGMDAPKEHRVSKLADQLAYGLGGFYGYTLLTSLLPRLPFSKSLSVINRINVAKLPFLPFTVGGFFQMFVLSSLFGDKVADVFRWPVNKIFGKPPKDDVNNNDAMPVPPTMPSAYTGVNPPMGPRFGPQYPLAKAFPTPYASMPTMQHYPPYPQPQAPAASQIDPAAQSLPVATSPERLSPVSDSPKVLYSTEGLGNINQISRNHRQDRAQSNDEALMKQLKMMKRELS